MINVDDKVGLAKECVAAGAQFLVFIQVLMLKLLDIHLLLILAAIAEAVGDSAKISVAGGVKADTAQQVKDAGASIL